MKIFNKICVIALLLIIFMAGHAVNANALLPDTIAPTVNSTNPASDATDVAINQKITVTFSEAMKHSTINKNTFTLTQGTKRVPGKVTYAGVTATFKSAKKLATNTQYTATITTKAKDRAGNKLASNYIWSFTTRAATGGTISGTAVKGPVANATMTAFSINNGAMGSQIGTGQTDGQGNFSMSVGDYSGPVMLQLKGGSYMDEATGTNMPMQQSDMMTSVIPSMFSGDAVNGIQMTPLTSMAQTMAQGMAGGMTSANITAANTGIGNYFMVNDILHTHPMNPLTLGAGSGADQNMKNYGMAIGAMSQYANNVGMSFSSAMVTAMMNDVSDGLMNGMMGNSSVTMRGGMMGGSMMSPNAGTSGMANAMTQFIQSTMNQSGVTLQDMQSMIDKLMTSNGMIQ